VCGVYKRKKENINSKNRRYNTENCVKERREQETLIIENFCLVHRKLKMTSDQNMGEKEVKNDDEQQVFEEFKRMIHEAKFSHDFGEILTTSLIL
jgi:hypothetical protein